MKWIKIKDFDYEVSETGIVRRCFVSKGTNANPLKSYIGKSGGYLLVDLYKGGCRKKFYIHRLLAEYYLDGFSDDCVIDHIDGDRLNNNLDNLRITNWRGNAHNTLSKKNKTSTHYGVAKEGYYKDGTPRWRARFYVNGKNLSLGSYKSEEEAHKAYQKKIKELEK